MAVNRTINKKGKVFRYRHCGKCKKSIKTVEMSWEGWNYKAMVDQIKKIVNEKRKDDS